MRVPLPETECTAVGGMFREGACETVTCPIVGGACCLPDGSCEPLAEDADLHSGGINMGDGISCDMPGMCDTPAEESSWGRVKSQYR